MERRRLPAPFLSRPPVAHPDGGDVTSVEKLADSERGKSQLGRVGVHRSRCRPVDAFPPVSGGCPEALEDSRWSAGHFVCGPIRRAEAATAPSRDRRKTL